MRLENPSTLASLSRLLLVAGLAMGLSACGMRSTLTEDRTGHPLKVEDGEGEDEEMQECGAGVMPCHLDDLNGATCETLGYEGGELFCDPRTCLYDTQDCDGGGDGDGDGGDGDGQGGMGGGQGGIGGGQGGGFFGGGGNDPQ